ncbi:DUF4169 family protein [Synechococcus sp. MU1644]|nr:DUF4169 family protein [Synechococcus sp. MU1644]
MAQRPSRGLGLVEPVNLNKHRKAKARVEKQQRASENRIKYGRTKAEKARDEFQKGRDARGIDESELDP